MAPEYPKMSPAPNWTEIFTLRPELDPPGYAETVIHILDNPYVKPKEAKKEEKRKNKKKTAVGRNDKS